VPTNELSPLDVENYTQGRLNRDDPETVRVLAAALGAARRYCGWHVTPVLSAVQMTVDGPGSPLLVLPTLRMVAMSSLTEDGVAVDLSTVRWSSRGLVRKKNRCRWTCEYGGIVATITHGFDDAEAWQSAVLSLIDRWSQLSDGGEARVIGPFQYDTTREAAGSAFTDVERFILDSYALEKAP
jgi:hypothetical protein